MHRIQIFTSSLTTATLAVFLFALPASAQVASQFKNIDRPGRVETTATGINDSNVIVGDSATADQENMSVEFGYTRTSGKYATIKVPNSWDTSVGGIAQTGNLTGHYAETSNDPTFCGDPTTTPCRGDDKIFIYRKKTKKFTKLNIPSCCPDAEGINKSDEVVGNYEDPVTGNNRGFLWKKGIMFNLDFPGATETEAKDINDKHVVVGTYSDADFNDHGFVWYRGAFAPIDVPAAVDTDVWGISEDNDIVGSYNDADNVEHGFLFRNGEYFYPIDYPGADETTVKAINDEGWIVGSYQISSEDESHAFRAKVSDPD